MTAWPPLFVLIMRTFFFSAALALIEKEETGARLEVVWCEIKLGEIEIERGEER